MLAPHDLVTTAGNIFAAPAAEAAARAANMQMMRVRAAASGNWRLLHQENPVPVRPSQPLFSDLRLPPIAPPQAAVSRIWLARHVKLAGRRGLVGDDGGLFLAGPVRNEAELGRAIADAALGGEGMILRRTAGAEAQLLMVFANGDRRLTGTGLHLGGALGANARPPLTGQLAVLLMIAAMQPKLDYVVLDDPGPELPALLEEVGLGELKIFNVAQLQGVMCTEILMPVMAHDPGGWIDTATIGRLRAFAARAHAKLGPGIHAEPVKVFLTDSDRADTPLARLVAQRGYEVRGLAERSAVEQALLMAKASHVAIDCADHLTATLFAAAHVPVLDFIGGELAAQIPLLAGAERPYGFATVEHAERALARIESQDQRAA